MLPRRECGAAVFPGVAAALPGAAGDVGATMFCSTLRGGGRAGAGGGVGTAYRLALSLRGVLLSGSGSPMRLCPVLARLSWRGRRATAVHITGLQAAPRLIQLSTSSQRYHSCVWRRPCTSSEHVTWGGAGRDQRATAAAWRSGLLAGCGHDGAVSNWSKHTLVWQAQHASSLSY